MFAGKRTERKPIYDKAIASRTASRIESLDQVDDFVAKWLRTSYFELETGNWKL